MKSLRTLLLDTILLTGTTFSQAQIDSVSSQALADSAYVQTEADSVHHHTELRTNLLYLATATPNISIDFGLARHWSLSITAGYNPFKYPKRHRNDNKIVNPKTLHWLVEPELRLWFREHLRGGYMGLHGIYAQYNIGGLAFIPAINNNRYEGYLYGGGLAFGWHWWLGRKHRTGLDLSLGAGYLRLHYDKYKACNCSGLLGTYDRNYIGPTRAAISLTYLIK